MMTISSGAQFGFYQISGPLGAGGMGEVYRATDTKLKREVALKVLPQDFATDAERLARFQREAELLASLNHSNIAQIFGIEKADGITALVMELIDGPTLAERIEQGPLLPDDALNIALQIADALEAAHERGIVHRDLKPANIKLKLDGHVKVLDFGIAKAIDPALHSSGRLSPQLTTPAMTQSGMILGTAAYMSPEQARGKFVDRRTDIWAFGCVLFEMLTGQPAFGAEDVPMTLARVLSQATDMRSLPAATPPALRQTLELCLEKDPKKRIADISDVRLALKGRFESALATPQSSASSSRPRWLAGGLVASIFAAFAGWWLKPELVQDLSINRFAYAIPAAQELVDNSRNVLAVSADGRRFAYHTTQGLFVRDLGELEAQLVPGTAGVLATPIFSPDGESLVYHDFTNKQLKRSATNSGASVVLASGVLEAPADASWASDNHIYYSQSNGIWRVPGTGGTPEHVIQVQPNGERISNPQLLDDGDTLLLSADLTSRNIWDEDTQIVAQSLTSKERTVLVQGGIDPLYLPSGHLVFAIGNDLFAVAFDADTLKVSGGAVPLVQGALRALTTANYGVSANGTLVYLNGATSQLETLVWVDRGGNETPLPIEPDRMLYPRIAPDGNRIALAGGSTTGLWVWDSRAETKTQLTIGEASGSYAVWTADGTRIAYIGAGKSLDWRAANNTGQATPIADFVSTGLEAPTAYFFTPSGQELVYRNQATPGTQDDIAMLTVGGTAEPVWLLNEPYNERNAALSPNGRWMAYQSDESGRYEVYVRPFPNVDDDRVQVSNAGGEKPLWSHDGNELFYLQSEAFDTDMQMISVTVATGEPRFAFSTRIRLMDWPYRCNCEGRNYDVAADGQRFLTVRRFDNPEEVSTAPQIIIVQNWAEELKRLVPAE